MEANNEKVAAQVAPDAAANPANDVAVVAAVEAPNASVAGAEAPILATDALVQYMREVKPELAEADEATIMADVLSDLKRQQAFNAAMAERFDSDDVLADIMQKSLTDDGYDFMRGLAELLTGEELDEYIKEAGGDYAKASNARKERLKAERERNALVEANVEKSQQALAAYIGEMIENEGWDEAKAAEFEAGIRAILVALQDGLLERSEIEKFRRMLNFDEMVSKAREEGVLEGKNAQISGLRQAIDSKAGDGLPAGLGGGGVVAKETPVSNSGFEDLIALKTKKYN